MGLSCRRAAGRGGTAVAACDSIHLYRSRQILPVQDGLKYAHSALWREHADWLAASFVAPAACPALFVGNFPAAQTLPCCREVAPLGAMRFVGIMRSVIKLPLSARRVMTPPDSVLELVERFEHNREAYRSGHY